MLRIHEHKQARVPHKPKPNKQFERLNNLKPRFKTIFKTFLGLHTLPLTKRIQPHMAAKSHKENKR